MKKKYNILVTGVGAIIGYGIIESIRLANIDCKIIGVDVFEENYGKYVCDDFVNVPFTSDPNYKEVINSLIEKYQIDLIFPGIEQDLHYFNDNQKLFNSKIVLNKNDLISLSKDKLIMFEFLKSSSYKYLIPTYYNLDFIEAVKKCGIPFIIKPKKSYASKGFYVIRNQSDFSKLLTEINDETLFQPFVGTDDEEYTISVFGNGKGGTVDSLILRRYLSKAGASEKTFTIKDDEVLMKAVNDLVSIFSPVGPTNFQFRKKGEEVYLLEINPRISSACSLRTKFGYNDPALCIQYYLEEARFVLNEKREGKAIRYIADKIIYE